MKNRYNKIVKLIFVFFILTNVNYAQNNFFQWANSNGSSLDDVGKSVTADATGNVYNLGEYRNTVDFDPSVNTLTLSSNGSADLYITKTDANGNIIWAKSFGGPSAEKAGAITTDATGNIYVTGSFQNTVDFDPSSTTFNLTSSGSYDIFVFKLNSSGSLIWARNMGGSSADEGNAINVSSSGDVYTTGFYNGTANFDPSVFGFSLTSVASSDIFVCKLTPSGNFSWAKSFGGTSSEVGLSIITNLNGIFFTGYFQGTADFDPGISTFNLNSAGSNDPFVCKLDFAGSMLFAFRLGGTGADVANAITTDSNSDIVITGQFNGTANFNPTTSTNTLTSLGSTDVFVAKYSNLGTFLWVKKFGGSFADNAYCISVDTTGNIYTTGSFKNNVDFDPNAGTFTITSNANSSDVFIHKIDQAGNFVWVKTLGDAADDIANGICVDNNNNIFTTGYYRNTVDFNTDTGTYSISAVGLDDAYLHKLGSCVVPINTTSNANLNICTGQYATLTASGSGLLTWYPTASSTTSLATGPIYNTPILSTGTYSYYVQSSTCSLPATRMLVAVNVSVCTGLNENPYASSPFNVYPNPSSGNYALDSDNEAELFVFNLQGKQIINEHINKGKHLLDLTRYNNGLYFLKIQSKSSTINLKLIKQ